MKVLHVGVGNLGSGGVATYVHHVVPALRDRGHEVLMAELWSQSDSIHDVQERLSDLDDLARLGDKFRPDVTHIHSQLPGYGQLRSAAVLTAHEHSAFCPSGGRYLASRRRCCERSVGLANCLWGHFVDNCGSRSPSSMRDRFKVTAAATEFSGHWIAPSSYTQEGLLKRGLDPCRIHLVANPQVAPHSDCAPRIAGDPSILFLGRLVPNKGCDVLVRALAELPPASRLVVVGDGPERSKLEQLATTLGVASRIEFTGWENPEGVKERLRQARVLAVPSLWPEPFGLVALEAYAAGCPVVASASGGLVDLIEEGVTGRLVQPDNPLELSRALLPYLLDADLATRAGMAGQEMAERRFSFVEHLESLERVYALSLGTVS